MAGDDETPVQVFGGGLDGGNSGGANDQLQDSLLGTIQGRRGPLQGGNQDSLFGDMRDHESTQSKVKPINIKRARAFVYKRGGKAND